MINVQVHESNNIKQIKKLRVIRRLASTFTPLIAFLTGPLTSERTGLTRSL